MRIHRHAYRGNIAGVQQELERGIDIEAIDTQADFVDRDPISQMTPLQCALFSPLAGADMVKFLLDRGALQSPSPRQRKNDLRWVLNWLAARKQKPESYIYTALRRLAMRDRKPDIYWAIRSGNIEKIQSILDLGADINYIDRNNCIDPEDFKVLTNIFCQSRSPKEQNLFMQFIMSKGINMRNYEDNLIDEDERNLLIHILLQSKSQTEAIPLVELLIAKGINIDSGERSVLELAARLGWFEVVRLLLLATEGDRAALGWTDLMEAIIFGTMSEVELLLDRGADLTAVDACGRTPWLLSLHGGDLSKSQRLLLAGSNLLEVGNSGKLPLMYALESGNLSMLAWLIEMGADIRGLDRNGESTFELAVKQDRSAAASILIETGKIPAYEASGLLGIDLKNPKMLCLLLSAGADIRTIEDCSDRDVYEREEFDNSGLSYFVPSFVPKDDGDYRNAKPSMRSLLTRAKTLNEWELDPQDYRADKHRRFGWQNPERIDAPFWRKMVEWRSATDVIRSRYRDECHEESIWCFHRFGQSITTLPDGRVIEIGGRYEDRYSPDFCIYNDVIVHDGQGNFQIYAYPRDVFPPTDFHTATLVDNWIYIISSPSDWR